MLNNNEIELLNELINKKEYTFKDISEKYKVSDRAARYYIHNIDYLLELLNYDLTEKTKDIIKLNPNQDFSKIYEILKSNKKLSLQDRIKILKMILFFDKKGLNITNISNALKISRTTIKKDLAILEKELLKDEIKLIYVNNKGYKLEGQSQKILIKEVELVSEIIFQETKNIKIELSNYFYKYIKKEEISNTKKFIFEIEKIMKLNINKESYNKFFSYILILINSDKKYEKEELVSLKFLENTEEYKKIKEILKHIKKKEIKSEILVQITDLIMGVSINGFENNSFENWVDEGLIIKKMIANISKKIANDLSKDEILYSGLLYHIKPAIYRIKNNIQISNSVYRELIIANDPILEIVRKSVKEIEKLFKIEFPEDEIALIGFHINASVERSSMEKTKKIILVCGLGYGSSKILEQSLKENYDIDIIDVLPYYLVEDLLLKYKNIDLILSTMDIEEKLQVPVVKINPILREEDFKKLSGYGIKRNFKKISLSSIIDVIEKYSKITDKENLIKEFKTKFSGRIVDDVFNRSSIISELLTEKNVKFLNNVKNWEEAIRESGNLLVENKSVNNEYVEEIIKLIHKHGAYMVIDEGIAIPHAGISENVFKTGISLLVVKEKVYFPNGKGANIFFSFSSTDNENHKNIINELFELITEYDFVNKVLKMNTYEEIQNYFREEN